MPQPHLEVSQADLLDVRYLPIVRWADAINASKTHVRKLLNEGVISGVSDGGITKIREAPRSYLESLPPYQKGTGPGAGPGRGHHRPRADVRVTSTTTTSDPAQAPA